MLCCSLLQGTGATASAIMQYGHGLLGTRAEATTSWLRVMANAYDWVVVATDWYGMSQFDVLPLVRILLGDLSYVPLLCVYVCCLCVTAALLAPYSTPCLPCFQSAGLNLSQKAPPKAM